MWGLRPGPTLFQDNPDFAWGLIASMYIGNVMLVLFNVLLIPVFVRALRVPCAVLAPAILVLCLVGAYAANNRMWDVGVMIAFGVVGVGMRVLGYSPAAFITALVLGPLAENAFRQSMQIAEGNAMIFLTRADRGGAPGCGRWRSLLPRSSEGGRSRLFPPYRAGRRFARSGNAFAESALP